MKEMVMLQNLSKIRLHVVRSSSQRYSGCYWSLLNVCVLCFSTPLVPQAKFWRPDVNDCVAWASWLRATRIIIESAPRSCLFSLPRTLKALSPTLEHSVWLKASLSHDNLEGSNSVKVQFIFLFSQLQVSWLPRWLPNLVIWGSTSNALTPELVTSLSCLEIYNKFFFPPTATSASYLQQPHCHVYNNLAFSRTTASFYQLRLLT